MAQQKLFIGIFRFLIADDLNMFACISEIERKCEIMKIFKNHIENNCGL